MTREEYLEHATRLLRGKFKQSGHEIPERVRVSVGFPGGGSARKRIGEHWHPKSSQDNVSQIFISPVLNDSYSALDVLVHELIHACYPNAKHRGDFARACKDLGLSKPYKAAGVPKDSPLGQWLTNILIPHLGDFPHAAINLADRKKQTTRLVKVECCDCGYTCRVTSKWLEQSGAPLCPCSEQPMQIESKGE